MTGHSLGGSLALLLALDVTVNHNDRKNNYDSNDGIDNNKKDTKIAEKKLDNKSYIEVDGKNVKNDFNNGIKIEIKDQGKRKIVKKSSSIFSEITTLIKKYLNILNTMIKKYLNFLKLIFGGTGILDFFMKRKMKKVEKKGGVVLCFFVCSVISS